MLFITVPEREYYDENSNKFFMVKEQTLQLEHSLVSISKWESKWKKPFLSKEVKTIDETIDYIRCMTITQNVDPRVYYNINNEHVQAVENYILDPMTATWFSKSNSHPSREVQTSETIYWQMITLGIPLECQKWHLNRLLTLIRVCNERNTPGKKMSKNEIFNSNRALNAARRKSLHTRG